MSQMIHLRYGTRVAALPSRWHAAISQWFAIALLCAAPGMPLLPARTTDGKPARDLTFFVVSDTHYGLSPEGDRTLPLLVDKMNQLPGTAYPAAIGGTVAKPLGVVHLGDATNDGKKEQWAMFVRDQWEGIDIYHPPHFKQKDPKKNDGPVSHGFFVFHLTADELTVAERKSDDTWGMTSRKKLPTATVTAQPPVTHP